MVRTRLLSFSLVISLGFLLLVSLVLNGLAEGLMDNLQAYFPQAKILLVYAINQLFTLLLTSSLFAIIYKVLPDAHIRWKDVAVGAVFTAVLFYGGSVWHHLLHPKQQRGYCLRHGGVVGSPASVGLLLLSHLVLRR